MKEHTSPDEELAYKIELAKKAVVFVGEHKQAFIWGTCSFIVATGLGAWWFIANRNPEKKKKEYVEKLVKETFDEPDLTLAICERVPEIIAQIGPKEMKQATEEIQTGLLTAKIDIPIPGDTGTLQEGLESVKLVSGAMGQPKKP